MSRKAESAGEMFAKPYVRTDCAEFKPVEIRRWASREAGSPVTCSGEEVTSTSTSMGTSMKIAGHPVSKGVASGEILISETPISFLGGIDPNTGEIIEKNHPMKGVSIANRVFLFPYGKGSTVGSYIIYSLKKNGVAPCAMINLASETIVAVGAIISDIPLVDRLKEDPFTVFHDGDLVEVDGTRGHVTWK